MPENRGVGKATDGRGGQGSPQQRKAKARMITGCVILGLLLAVAWASRVYYYNFFFGPFPADDERILAAATEPGDGNLLGWVEVRGRRLEPLDVAERITIDDRLHTEFPFFVTPVGEKMVLVLARSEADGQNSLGTLYRMPPEFQANVVDRVVAKRPELAGKFLPVMLNTTPAFTVIGWIGLALGAPLLLVASMLVFRGISRL